MKTLLPSIADAIRDLFNGASEFVIVSPWIQVDALAHILGDNHPAPGQLKVLLRGDDLDFLKGATDTSAIRLLLERGARIALAHKLHAKVYIADNNRAIITSANLTLNGLGESAELGIRIDRDQDSTEELDILIAQVDKWFEEAGVLSEEDVSDWIQQLEELKLQHGVAYRSLHQQEEGLVAAPTIENRARLTVTPPTTPIKRYQPNELGQPVGNVASLGNQAAPLAANPPVLSSPTSTSASNNIIPAIPAHYDTTEIIIDEAVLVPVPPNWSEHLNIPLPEIIARRIRNLNPPPPTKKFVTLHGPYKHKDSGMNRDRLSGEISIQLRESSGIPEWFAQILGKD